MVCFLSNRVVDTAHYLLDFEDFFCDLTCHDITVIAIGDSYKRIRFFDPGSYQYFFVNSIAWNSFTAKIRTQALECFAAEIRAPD